MLSVGEVNRRVRARSDGRRPGRSFRGCEHHACGPTPNGGSGAQSVPVASSAARAGTRSATAKRLALSVAQFGHLLRPALRAVEHPQHFDLLAVDSVEDDVRRSGNHELTHARLVTRASKSRKLVQSQRRKT